MLLSRRLFSLAARLTFAAYALALVVGTHWPRLDLHDAPLQASDKVLHFVAFFFWTVFLTAAAFFGPALSRRNRLRAAAIAAIYAPLDELTQAIPGVNRAVSALDLAANLGGVAVAALLLALTARLARSSG